MAAKTWKTFLRATLTLAVLGGAAGTWLWFQKKPGASDLTYKTAATTRGELVQTVTANGQISPVKSVVVGSQVSGIIVDIKVDFNSKVTNGQVIAQIDPSTYQLYINQAEAELANTRASLELAELNYNRARSLFTNQLIAQSDFDGSLVALHQAQAVNRVREASLQKARVDFDRTTIYSPIDGVVISRAVDVGQTVAASFNTPTLFNIANDLRNMRIEAMVSEADVGGVREGQPVKFTVDAHPSQQFLGEITQVRYAPVTNQNVVNYVTVVEVGNPELKLRPGMTANASIIIARKPDALRVPNAALRFRPPENAWLDGATNAPVVTNQVAGAESPRGGGAGPRSEETRRRMEGMTPEEREQARARFREGGGRGMRGGGTETVATRTLYLVETAERNGRPASRLRAVPVKTGITDGQFTEILDGLKEGDVIATGQNNGAAKTAASTTTSASPFGSPFGGRPPR
jgi:HlyD family secretion protein